MNIHIGIFQVMTLRSVVQGYQHFPRDGDSVLLWNLGTCVLDYTVSFRNYHYTDLFLRQLRRCNSLQAIFNIWSARDILVLWVPQVSRTAPWCNTVVCPVCISCASSHNEVMYYNNTDNQTSDFFHSLQWQLACYHHVYSHMLSVRLIRWQCQLLK